MHVEKLRKGISFELRYPHINRPGSLILVNPLWPHGFFCSWKENERNMKGKWKQWATLRFINTKQGPTDLVDLVDLVGGVINPMLALLWYAFYPYMLLEVGCGQGSVITLPYLRILAPAVPALGRDPATARCGMGLRRSTGVKSSAVRQYASTLDSCGHRYEGMRRFFFWWILRRSSRFCDHPKMKWPTF